MLESSERINEELNTYALIAERLNIPVTALVYYPCSGPDTYPRQGFLNNRFIFADQDAASMAELSAQGYEAHCVDVRTFEPDPHGIDVMILQNPQLNALELIDQVKPGGLIICNNYHASAKQLWKQPDMDLVAVVYDPRENPKWKDTDLDGCFQYVTNDQELEATGKLAKYQKLVDTYGADIVGDSIVARYRSLYDRSYDTTLNDHIINNAGPMGFLPLPGLPTKERFGLDDVAIFRKKEEAAEIIEARKKATIDSLAAVLPEAIETWLEASLIKALGLVGPITSKAQLVDLLMATKLTPIKLVIIEVITEYFQQRAAFRAQFEAIGADDRWKFTFGLESRYPITKDPVFQASPPQSVLDAQENFFAPSPNEE